MKIFKKEKFNKDGRHEVIVFEFPAELPRFNPYMDDDEQFGTYPTFTGLIVRHRKGGSHWDEMGFAATIDRDYKGKNDDVGDFIVKWDGNEEGFLKVCKEMGWNVHEIED